MQFQSGQKWNQLRVALPGFLTLPVCLSCTSLVCAHCQMNAAGQQASRALGGATGWRIPGSLSHCVEKKSRGGSLAHIVGLKEQVDSTGVRHCKVIMSA